MKNDRRSMPGRTAAVLASCVLAFPAAPLAAQTRSLALSDTFEIGTNGLCEAQILPPEPGDGLYDRRYSIICRDASAPVGSLWVQRGGHRTTDARAFAAGEQACTAAESVMEPAGLSILDNLTCRATVDSLKRIIVVGEGGGKTYAANGLAVYSDALRLGLESLAMDRAAPGEVSVPLTQAGDDQAFARARAEAISADAALAEAYNRNNSGKFAEAAAFFGASANGLPGEASGTEALLNNGLQQSNLGNYAEAERLFATGEARTGGNPVLGRLLRNFRALHALNRGRPNEAIAQLGRSLPSAGTSEAQLGRLRIDGDLAGRLSAEQGNQLSGAVSGLTPLERAQLLDGQAGLIRASAQRLLGRIDAARLSLEQARRRLIEVRGGNVASVTWLRAQALGELAEISEQQGDVAGAEALHGEGIALLETSYPGTPALQSAQSQMAGFYARNGRQQEALALYDAIVGDIESRPASSLRRLLSPYFALMADRGDGPDVAAQMFAASQLLLRPGLAQTQAVLARELSGGTDEAAQLFRQAINLSRAVEIKRSEVVQLERLAVENPDLAASATRQRALLEQLREQQLATQARLADYPRYRAVSDERMSLAEMQQTLREGEAYLKLVTFDDAAYAIYAEPDSARAYRVAVAPLRIAEMVDSLRDSIAIEEFGQTITYPFDIATARELYSALFAPVDERLQQVRHLVFEPDGPMLRLPANLLVMDDASVRSYAARTAGPAGDPYDFTGTAWLGKRMQVSTAVSPGAFRDVRNARASDASGSYIGFGENEPLDDRVAESSGVRSGAGMDARCQWSRSTWGNPIQADELQTASLLLGERGTRIVTGSEFTDTGLRQMPSLDDYRIMHFATHGLVTTPAPDCPPRPALLTSFGDKDSDGLLTFAEIYDLRIDADLVILSACNTASGAGALATQEAGISGGGDFALDGLVRAFVGAGGRTIVASHWPVPDDFDATRRLITGFFQVPEGTGTAEALRNAQLPLMDDPDTSHPFYWSAFAVVGDGSVPVRR